MSNQTGDQLDYTQAPIDVLLEIVEAIAGRAEIVIDGGFSRRADIIKGLSLGAKLVAIGRNDLWGLITDGSAGVSRALELLREEMAVPTLLSVQTNVRNITPNLIRRVDSEETMITGN